MSSNPLSHEPSDPTLVFHESFDSTRATAEHPDDHPNLAQAQAEAVISLLLGRSLSVNHTYAFDSRGLLELADVVLQTWEQAKRHASGAGRAALAEARPIVLHRFRQPTFFAACCDQLRRSDNTAINYFELSAWKPINDSPRVRQALADTLEHGDSTRHPLPAEIRQNPQLARYLAVLRRLNAYFEESAAYGRDREARFPQAPLQAYVTRLLALSPQQLTELVAGCGCPAETAERLQAAVRQKAAEATDGVATVNRYWVHKEGGPAWRDPILGDQLRELVDTLYNAVMADSAYAQFAYMSSVPRVDGRDELKHANALAMELIRDTRLAPGELPAPDGGRRSVRMAGMLAAAEATPELSVAPLRAVFEAYWALLADDERRNAWQDSCTSLDGLVRRDSPVDQHLRDAWRAHLSQLETSLPHLLGVERGRLAVPIQTGDVGCEQTMDLDQPSEDELNRSFAAGEYLDDLARSLGTDER